MTLKRCKDSVHDYELLPPKLPTSKKQNAKNPHSFSPFEDEKSADIVVTDRGLNVNQSGRKSGAATKSESMISCTRMPRTRSSIVDANKRNKSFLNPVKTQVLLRSAKTVSLAGQTRRMSSRNTGPSAGSDSASKSREHPPIRERLPANFSK